MYQKRLIVVRKVINFFECYLSRTFFFDKYLNRIRIEVEYNVTPLWKVNKASEKTTSFNSRSEIWIFAIHFSLIYLFNSNTTFTENLHVRYTIACTFNIKNAVLAPLFSKKTHFLCVTSEKLFFNVCDWSHCSRVTRLKNSFC